jgi:DNA invertase Pin-like site-specific DNA recombinase
MRVIAYARVSTVEQAEGGISLDAQIAKMVAYASLYDLTIIETIMDPGESGKTLNRPGLRRALGLMKAGKADGLLIVKLDRLTRSIADWQDLIDAYFGARGGKQLLSVNDSIDTRTAAGRLVLNVLITVAQWERETIGERTRDALQHKIRNGQRVGKVRFGFDLAADGVTLIDNPAEQQIVTLMRDLRAAGHTLRQIAAALTARGILTKEGNAQWQHQTVAYILRRAA